MPRFELPAAFASTRAAGCMLVATLLLAACSRSLRPEPEVRTQVEPAHSAGAPGASRVAAPANSGAVRAALPARGQGVAVVELFTSEGCSSCPPADRVLSRLASRATADALPLYTLSFHVDYWNYLGWRDRFSSSSYSERQRGYASINPSGGSYTPQAVVNGASECVGSDASRIDAYVAAALKQPSRTRIELEARRTAAGIDISYRVSGDIAGRVLNLALLEPQAESAVKSGENAGEHLAHVNVVRAFTSRVLASDSAGTWSFAPPAELGKRPLGVVAYAEGASQRDVSGASALTLE